MPDVTCPMSDADSEDTSDSILEYEEDASNNEDACKFADDIKDIELDKTVSPTTSDLFFHGEKDEDDNAEFVLGELAQREFTVFVLSEVGKPIFVSCGHEEDLCSLTALMQTFVMVTESWEDSLIHMRSQNLHISFSHRGPLIICLVSHENFLLDVQVDLIYKQVLSILCRSQLLSIFELKGPSFDLRFLLRGMDRHITELLRYYRSDASVFLKGMRVFPMPLQEREFITNTISSCISNVKVHNIIYGFIVVHRQIVSLVHMNGIQMHPYDLQIIINLIECTPSLRNAHNWIPICLPHFNDGGFVHSFISYLWENSSACLVLISLEKTAFELLRIAAEMIVTKLKNSKSFVLMQSLFDKPPIFEIDSEQFPNLWHFVLKKNSTNQICIPLYRIPYVSQNERLLLQMSYHKLVKFCANANIREMVVTTMENCFYVNVTPRFKFYSVSSPFASKAQLCSQAERIFKMFKKDDTNFFNLSASFT